MRAARHAVVQVVGLLTNVGLLHGGAQQGRVATTTQVSSKLAGSYQLITHNVCYQRLLKPPRVNQQVSAKRECDVVDVGVVLLPG